MIRFPMRYKPAKTPETVIFLHIPNTAGTTLEQIIFRHYRFDQIYTTGALAQQGVKDFQNMSEEERGKYRLVKGHMSFGIHDYIPGPWAYFTFFREPIERTISYFYFILRASKHPIYDIVHEKKIDLKQCLEAGLDPMLFNCHTRLLAGVWAELPPGQCTREHLEKAKANLHYFKVIGLTEQFDASLLLLGKAFGWSHFSYTRQNVTAGRPSQRDLSPETLAAVHKANQFDKELYDYAKTLFAEQIRQQGPEFAKALNRLRFNNRFVSPLVALYWEMRKISVRVFVRQQIARIRH
ncbi:MAG: sulfotransferase family 2 domain-containing protein [Candidatus Promineifilaceae bacterium]